MRFITWNRHISLHDAYWWKINFINTYTSPRRGGKSALSHERLLTRSPEIQRIYSDIRGVSWNSGRFKGVLELACEWLFAATSISRGSRWCLIVLNIFEEIKWNVVRIRSFMRSHISSPSVFFSVLVLNATTPSKVRFRVTTLASTASYSSWPFRNSGILRCTVCKKGGCEKATIFWINYVKHRIAIAGCRSVCVWAFLPSNRNHARW